MHEWNEKYEPYVGDAKMYQEKVDTRNIPPDKILIVDADIGRKVDFKRIATHHVVLPPYCRTSYPHAESIEEEFVYVLKGSPHLWLNGYIYELREGHAIGFPSGTGIAHTLINNSDNEVELLVAGERTKADNLCSFPINPEMKEGCKIWWDNPPKHILGPHDGLPHAVKPEEFGSLPSASLVHCPSEPRGKSFHYPGDNESFGEGFRISDKVGLKVLGVHYERLPAGKRSAFPHAHSHEEEFVFVIKGTPIVWLDGFTKELAPGFFAAFPANTGKAHVIINNSAEEIIYICIGESQDNPEDRIDYPLNPSRQRECEQQGLSWQVVPPMPQGNSPAYPKNQNSGSSRL